MYAVADEHVLRAVQIDWKNLVDRAGDGSDDASLESIDPFPDITELARDIPAHGVELEDIWEDDTEPAERRTAAATAIADYLSSLPKGANAEKEAERWRRRAEHPPVPRPAPWPWVDLLEAESAGSPEPTILTRQDGFALFYAGKVHNLVGESESGKTWLAIAVVLWVCRAGGTALFIDFEDYAGTFVRRLRALGATTPEIRAIHYRSANEPWDEAPRKLIRRIQPTVVVLDGVTEGMTLQGLDPLGTKDAAQWVAWVRQWALRGASVITIDHVTKDKSGQGRWALGSQHKMSGIDGAHYVISPSGPLRPGQSSAVSIRVGKDRHGGVRAHADPEVDASRLQFVGTFRFGLPDGGFDIVPPKLATDSPAVAELQSGEVVFIRNLRSYLAEVGEASMRKIKSEVPGVSGRQRQEIVSRLWETGLLVMGEKRGWNVYRLPEPGTEGLE